MKEEETSDQLEGTERGEVERRHTRTHTREKRKTKDAREQKRGEDRVIGAMGHLTVPRRRDAGALSPPPLSP